MSGRVMSYTEWTRLDGRQIPLLFPLMSRPDRIRILIVEKEGKIVGSASLVPILHLDGLWLDEDSKAGVGRALMRLVEQNIAILSDGIVMAGATDESTAKLLTRYHAVEVPMKQYALNFRREPCRKPS